VEPSQVRLGEDVIGYKNRKTSLAIHVKPTWAFSRVFLWSLQGLETPNWSRCGQTWQVTGTKAPDNQSVKSQELVFPQTSWTKSPLASLSKLILKQIGGVFEVSSSMQTFP